WARPVLALAAASGAALARAALGQVAIAPPRAPAQGRRRSRMQSRRGRLKRDLVGASRVLRGSSHLVASAELGRLWSFPLLGQYKSVWPEDCHAKSIRSRTEGSSPRA